MAPPSLHLGLMRGQKDSKMKKPIADRIEHKCPACNGTGFPTVMQPVQPIRKIYPAPCKKCGGKGRIWLKARRIHTLKLSLTRWPGSSAPDRVERDAGPRLTAGGTRPQQPYPPLRHLVREDWGGPTITFHLDRPCFGVGAVDLSYCLLRARRICGTQRCLSVTAQAA
jgi:hypothetical protein